MSHRLFISCVWTVWLACMSVHHLSAWCPWRPQRRLLDSLEFQLQTPAPCGARNQTCVLNSRAVFPAPNLVLSITPSFIARGEEGKRERQDHGVCDSLLSL